MEFWHGFLLITGVHLLAAASPGPDFVLVSQQTLSKGRRTGLICSLGITFGLGIHIIYSVLGLATVIAHSQPLLTTIKWLGGGYLMYLGWQGIQAKPKKPSDLANTKDVAVDVTPAEKVETLPTKKPSSHAKSTDSTIGILRRGFFVMSLIQKRLCISWRYLRWCCHPIYRFGSWRFMACG